MKQITINLADKYKIFIGEKIFSSDIVVDFCRNLGSSIVIVSDENVAKIYSREIVKAFKQKKISTHLFTFQPGEKNKSRATKAKLEDAIFKLGLSRDICIVALGGGITTDIAGFVAATYCRGVPVVYIPSSLLAMVDASIGGKTGVNTSFGKNLIGAFYQPKAVFIDVRLLNTLPRKELNCGMVELLKHAIIADKNLFAKIEQKLEKLSTPTLIDLIFKSCLCKKTVVEKDEKDYGIRQILNFGHTIGHALENLSNYKMTHGEAVALGMLAESYLSYEIGFLSQKDTVKIAAIIEKIMPISKENQKFLTKMKISELKKVLVLDKKAQNKVARFVLIDGIGKIHYSKLYGYTMPVPEKIISRAIQLFLDACKC